MAEPRPWALIWKCLAVLGSLILIVMGIRSIFLELRRDPWQDQYPHSSTSIMTAVRAGGAGMYDVAVLLRSPVRRLCVSKSGRDPRALASDEWGISETLLLGDREPFFSMEGVFSILVLDDKNNFKIESINKNEVSFRDDPGNRCVDGPARVTVEIREQSNPFDTKLAGKLHID